VATRALAGAIRVTRERVARVRGESLVTGDFVMKRSRRKQVRRRAELPVVLTDDKD
jgi:hypothetical protein